jgi:urea transport system ATP-binding protein
VPQGREIFPLLTVRENLETGFAPLPKRRTLHPRRRVRAVPGAARHAAPPRRRPLGRAAAATRHRPRAGDAAPLLALDEPTEGIQPSIIKDIGRAIEYLKSRGDMAILLVEQYFDFARELADRFYVLDRGEVAASGGPRRPRLA